MVMYGPVKNPTDIGRVNTLIRKQVKMSRTERSLEILYRQSLYLITLTHSPTWRNIDNIRRVRARAKKEFTHTARLINKRARMLGINKKYDTRWG